MKTFGLLAVCVTVITVFAMWSSTRDAEVKASATFYENCVKQQYGMTPVAWYEQNGKYPSCGN